MKVSFSSSSLSSVECKDYSVLSLFKVFAVRKKKVVLQISRQSPFKIPMKEFFLNNIKDYCEISSFTDIFQGLYLFFRRFQGSFSQKTSWINLSNLNHKKWNKEKNNCEEQKGSRLCHLCDSFYLFTTRSVVNSNVKLLQYSKIM